MIIYPTNVLEDAKLIPKSLEAATCNFVNRDCHVQNLKWRLKLVGFLPPSWSFIFFREGIKVRIDSPLPALSDGMKQSRVFEVCMCLRLLVKHP